MKTTSINLPILKPLRSFITGTDEPSDQGLLRERAERPDNLRGRERITILAQSTTMTGLSVLDFFLDEVIHECAITCIINLI